MNRLSKREKTLINLLVIVAILAIGIFYVIRPLDDKISSVQEDIYDQEFAVQEMKNAISLSGNTSDELSQAEAELSKYEARLYDYMPNYAISSLISSMLEENGLVPLSLSLSNTTYEPTASYDPSKELGSGIDAYYDEVNSSASASDQASDGTSSNDTSSSTDASADSTSEADATTDTSASGDTAGSAADAGYITKHLATASVKGDSTSMIKLISAVAQNESMDIFSITSERSAVDNSITYTIVFQIYMNSRNG